MEAITLGEIIQTVDGQLLGGDWDESILFTGFSIDSRTIKRGNLFVPLHGVRIDGHDFIGDALIGGAAGCLTTQMPDAMLPDKIYVLVRDPLTAYCALAKYYRGRQSVSIVAVTGSVGKTTAKNMLAAVLGEACRVHKMESDATGAAGLATTLLQIEPEDDVAVLELEMTSAEELSALADMAEPDMVVITNVEDISAATIAREMFTHMQSQCILLLNGDDPLLQAASEEARVPALLCGEESHCNLRAEAVEADGRDSLICTLRSAAGVYRMQVPAVSKFMIYPTLFAVAAGEKLGLSSQLIQNGIAHFAPTKLRIPLVRRGNGILILDDVQTASPQSMRAAVEALDTMPEGYKIAVLGDISDLGPLALPLHRGVGEYVRRTEIQYLIAIGRAAQAIYEAAVENGLSSAQHFDSIGDALPELARLLRPNTAILVSASKDMNFEQVVTHLQSITPEA